LPVTCVVPEAKPTQIIFTVKKICKGYSGAYLAVGDPILVL